MPTFPPHWPTSDDCCAGAVCEAGVVMGDGPEAAGAVPPQPEMIDAAETAAPATTPNLGQPIACASGRGATEVPPHGCAGVETPYPARKETRSSTDIRIDSFRAMSDQPRCPICGSVMRWYASHSDGVQPYSGGPDTRADYYRCENSASSGQHHRF